MDVAERRISLLLQALEHLPERALGAMLLHFGSPAALWQSDPSVWPSLGVPDRAVAELQALRDDERRARFDVEHQLAALARVSAGLLTLADPAYPPLLRQIFDPPPLLYYRGNADALQWPQVAVVGSRRASAVALRAARDFAAGLAANGLTVCSGLALGVDGAAHGLRAAAWSLNLHRACPRWGRTSRAATASLAASAWGCW
jgi:DNA processing protein